MLRAYFDESGTHDGSLVTAIGGFVAPAQKWVELEGKWAELLGEFEELGVKTFHMTDFLAQKGEFASMEGPFRQRLLSQIASLLAKAGVTTVYSAIVCEDWDNVVRDEGFLKQFPIPFFLCFEDVLRQLWEWSRNYGGGEKIAPMFSHHPEYHEKMAEAGRILSSTNWFPRLLTSITFGSPQDIIPLQAADFSAHSMREDIEHRNYHREHGMRRVGFYDATQGRYSHGHWFNAEGLELTVQRYKEAGEIYPLP